MRARRAATEPWRDKHATYPAPPAGLNPLHNPTGLRSWKDQAKTKRRILGIPTVKDRVVQSAAAIVLQPIWEADFHDHSYAYRPKRRTDQAMDKVREALLSGQVALVDAYLSSYFDLIPPAHSCEWWPNE